MGLPGDGEGSAEPRISSHSHRSPELRSRPRKHHEPKTPGDDGTIPPGEDYKSEARHHNHGTSTGGALGVASVVAEAKANGETETEADKEERWAKGGAGRGMALLGDLPSLGSKMVSWNNSVLSSLGIFSVAVVSCAAALPGCCRA